MRKLLIALVVAFVLTVPSRASADLMSWDLSGTVGGVDPVLSLYYMPGIETGMPLFARLTFDPADPFGFPNIINAGLKVWVGDAYCLSGFGPGHQFSGSPNYRQWDTPTICGGVPTGSGFPDIMALTFSSVDPFTAPVMFGFYWLDPTCVNTPYSSCTHTDYPGFGGTFTSVVVTPDSGSTALLFVLSMTGLIGCHHRTSNQRRGGVASATMSA
jgi:hypothetical protein